MKLKDGFKTTEFWFSLLVLVLLILAPKLGLTVEQMTQMLILAGIYTGGRAVPKALAALERKNE